jgi:hypothetical protein
MTGRTSAPPCRWQTAWMRRPCRAMAGLLLLLACGDAAVQEPVLGATWAPGTVGYGTARPSELFNGGVATGHVFDIVWDSWGDDPAVGHGIGYYSATGGSSSALEHPATVVAFDLGDCDGRNGYRQVRWFFVEQGQAIDLGGEPWYAICDALPTEG